MNVLIECDLDVYALVSTLREKLPAIEWRMGDSEYNGFYVLGHTDTGIRIKITEDTATHASTVPFQQRSGLGTYCLGVHFFDSKRRLVRLRKFLTAAVLKRRVIRAISARRS